MAGIYQSFTSPRSTEPDRDALQTQLRAADPTIGVQHVAGTPSYTLKKNSPWTAPQIAAAQTVIDTAPETSAQLRYQQTSRDKDRLATLAVIVRDRDVAAWTAMTGPQKKAAVVALADAWAAIRDFIETNL